MEEQNETWHLDASSEAGNLVLASCFASAKLLKAGEASIWRWQEDFGNPSFARFCRSLLKGYCIKSLITVKKAQASLRLSPDLGNNLSASVRPETFHVC